MKKANSVIEGIMVIFALCAIGFALYCRFGTFNSTDQVKNLVYVTRIFGLACFVLPILCTIQSKKVSACAVISVLAFAVSIGIVGFSLSI